MRKMIFILMGLLGCCGISAQVAMQDSVKIQFQTGKTHVDVDLGTNRQVLEGIKEKLQLNADDSVYYRLQKVLVIGGASPEGSIALNKRVQKSSVQFRITRILNHF